MMANADIRPEDYARVQARRRTGAACACSTRASGSIPTCCGSTCRRCTPTIRAMAGCANKAFRQAISCAVDRQAIVNTVYLGAAVPIYGPVTPANRTWYTDVAPGLRARSRESPRAVRLDRPDRSQRRRHARGRAGASGAVLAPDPARSPARARRRGHPGTTAQGRHHRRPRHGRLQTRSSSAGRRGITTASTSASRRARPIRR